MNRRNFFRVAAAVAVGVAAVRQALAEPEMLVLPDGSTSKVLAWCKLPQSIDTAWVVKFHSPTGMRTYVMPEPIFVGRVVRDYDCEMLVRRYQ